MHSLDLFAFSRYPKFGVYLHQLYPVFHNGVILFPVDLTMCPSNTNALRISPLVTSIAKTHPPSIWTHQRRAFELDGHAPK